MLKLILKRIIEAIPTLIILIIVSFLLMRFSPGSPFLTDKALSPEVMANLMAKYNLDAPLYQQLLNYMGNLLQGDFGPSFQYKDKSVNELLANAFPMSIKLGIVAFFFAVLLGVTAGVIAALRQNSAVDYGIMSFAMLGVVMPTFVSGPLLILVFAVNLGWFPAGGWEGGDFAHITLPTIALAVAYLASIARVTRGSMIETLNSNFIRTARAKGLSEYKVVVKHALKPAMLPVITIMGPAFVGIITGSLVIESVFGLPGMGKLFVNGALNRDYGLVLSLVVVYGSMTIFFNAIVDILYAYIDPKIRYD